MQAWYLLWQRKDFIAHGTFTGKPIDQAAFDIILPIAQQFWLPVAPFTNMV